MILFTNTDLQKFQKLELCIFCLMMTNHPLAINNKRHTVDRRIRNIVVISRDIDKNLANIEKNNIQKAGLPGKSNQCRYYKDNL